MGEDQKLSAYCRTSAGQGQLQQIITVMLPCILLNAQTTSRQYYVPCVFVRVIHFWCFTSIKKSLFNFWYSSLGLVRVACFYVHFEFKLFFSRIFTAIVGATITRLTSLSRIIFSFANIPDFLLQSCSIFSSDNIFVVFPSVISITTAIFALGFSPFPTFFVVTQNWKMRIK